MSEENRQQQSSAESTVAGAAKTGKAIASIAKGAATGGAHGAAVEAAKSSKKWIIPIVVNPFRVVKDPCSVELKRVMLQFCFRL